MHYSIECYVAARLALLAQVPCALTSEVLSDLLFLQSVELSHILFFASISLVYP